MQIGKNSQTRFQIIELGSAANTTADQLVETPIRLDNDFNRIIGIGFFQKGDGGAADGLYNVGARDKRRTWIDDISINAWNANSGVGPMDKYYTVDIPYVDGDQFYGRVTPTVNTNAALTGQMVLILERQLTEVPA